MNTLLLIDIQNDFLPGGSLAVPGGDDVIAVANAAIESASYVVATQDWHPADHGSFASQHVGVEIGQRFQLDGLDQVAWPDHCVQGSVGAEFASKLAIDRIDHVSRKGTDRLIDSYSGFFDNGRRSATDLDAHLREAGTKELTVMGLATDYCVKFTVIDGLRLGYAINVVLAGCRGVNLQAGDVESAIDEMRAAGAVIL
ncbi:MAG: bifunctional nicotinamidase/pyrazinamidase [Rubripirellula sp.]